MLRLLPRSPSADLRLNCLAITFCNCENIIKQYAKGALRFTGTRYWLSGVASGHPTYIDNNNKKNPVC